MSKDIDTTFDKIMNLAEVYHTVALGALQEALEKLPEKQQKEVLAFIENEDE